MDNISSTFKKYKPLILGLIQQELKLRGVSSSGSGAMQTHDLSGPYHRGTLGIAYVPDALDRNGSRALVGSLALGPGVLIGGVNLPDLKLDHDALASAYSAHAASSAVAAHGTVGAHNHQSTANGGLLDHGLALSGLGDDDHTQYAAGVGSSITRAAKDVDGAINKTWTGNHTFQGSLVTRHHRPELNDTYDSGTEDYRWRQLFASELETILLKYKAVLAVDGEIVLAKQNGTLEANITAVQTTINFGQAMTVGDVIYIAGNAKVEYITVGSLVSGTTYNVTRNIDGSGADAWNQGQAWINFGHDGDMRIHIMGGSSNNPRIVLRRQGTAYNLTTDILKMDGTGMSITANSALTNEELRSYRFLKTDGSLLGALYSTANSFWNTLTLDAEAGAGDKSSVSLYAEGTAIGFLEVKSDTGESETRIGTSRTVLGAGLLGGNFESLLSFGSPSAFPTGQSANDIAYRQDYRAFFQWELASSAWRQVGVGSFASSFPTSPAPQTGMRVFRIDFRCYFVYDGSAWRQMGAGDFTGSFPASPVDNLRVYRSDRDLEYFWNSATSEWLTTTVFPATLIDANKLPPYAAAGYAAEAPSLVYEIPTHTYAARVVTTKFLVLTGATNNGSNYWTYRVRHQNNSGGAFTDLIALANTSAVAASTRVSVSTTAAAIPQAADGSVVALWLQAVGAPSNVTFRGTVYYRLVG